MICLSSLLQNIFINHPKYYNIEEKKINKQLVVSHIKSMDVSIISNLFDEKLFVYFFTLDIEGFKLIDIAKIEQALDFISNDEVKIDIFLLKDFLINPMSYKSCHIVYKDYNIIDFKKWLKPKEIFIELNNKIPETASDIEIPIENLFIYANYKTILYNSELTHNINLLKEHKYDLFNNDYKLLFYKTLEIKRKITYLKQSVPTKKINLSKIYLRFPFLEKIIKTSTETNYIEMIDFCNKLMEIIFIDKSVYNNFIESIEYIFNIFDKNLNDFSFIEDLNYPITQLDKILVKDLLLLVNDILPKKNKIYLYTFNKRFGINNEIKENFREIGEKFNVKKQRIEQIQKSILEDYNQYCIFSTGALFKIIKGIIIECVDLKIALNSLRNFFANDEDFYFYLESISNKSFKSLLFPDINIKIFEEYSLNNQMPYSYDEIFNIIEENTLIEKDLIKYSISYLVKMNQMKMIDLNNYEEAFYIPLTLSLPTMYSQILLSYPDGQHMNDTINEIESKFNIKTSRQNMEMDRYKSTYLYGSTIYRHTSFFEKKYTEENIIYILNKIKDYLSSTNDDKNIHQCIKYLESISITINYYDLRYMIKKHGSSYNTPILLAGKSNVDIVSLNEPKGKSLKTIIINFIDKNKGTFQIENLYEKINIQYNTVDTTFLNLLKEGKYLSKVDSLHYCKPSFAFANIDNLDELLIKAITSLFDENRNLFMTLSFIENNLNTKFNLNYHKFWYLSFIRYHREKLPLLYEYESNVLSRINNNINNSLATIIKNLLNKYNYDKNLVEKNISQVVLCTNNEMKAAISSIVSKEKIK